MTTITNKIKEFCAYYKNEVNERLNRNLHSYQLLVEEIPTEIEDFLINNEIESLSVKGSIGQGNTTYYPWLLIYDRRVSTGASNGFYIVLLFSDDFEDVYLTLNQGSTIQEQAEQKRINDFIFSTIWEIDGFQKGQLPERSLVKNQPYSNSNNGKKYEKTNMFYKKYLVTELEEDLFISDMLHLIKEYSKSVAAYPNRNIKRSETPPVQRIREVTMVEGYNNLPKKFQESLKEANIIIDSELVTRFISLLCTKPFVILTGLSGSGKTKLAQAFSRWICTDENQYCIVPVGSDWTNREPLLGYPNALQQGEYITSNGVLELLIEASKNATKPYFLILDEMNLSHVERYFADFLSAIESGESVPLHPEGEVWAKCNIPAKIRIPENIFIIGTVNIDETTYMFSPKVLDRAGVIEFRVTKEEMEQFLTNPGKPDLKRIDKKGSSMAESFVKLALTASRESGEQRINEYLLLIFEELKRTGAEFGYRTASDIYRFARIVKILHPEEDQWPKNQITDAAIVQKLLPKVHGSRKKLEPVLKSLARLCLIDGIEISVDSILKGEIPITKENTRFPLSLEKITRMYNRIIQDGFTSFAEA
jgi:5-methylcytosine-specific restriction enzyme B